MRKKKTLTKRIIAFILILLMLVFIGIRTISRYRYQQTFEYKLKEIGYTNNFENIIDNFTEEEIDVILGRNYDENIYKLKAEKYFMFENLDRYLTYKEANEDLSLTDVVAIVNIGADSEFYTNIKDTNLDIEDPYLILVNKYHKLPSSYAPDTVVAVDSMYTYSNLQIDDSIYDNFKAMWNAAKEADLNLILRSGYRDYDVQTILFDRYTASHGVEEAETFSARPGHSEHQLGFALDIISPYSGLSQTFEDTEEFDWMEDNAHKFGFILRYPKNKTYLTGYIYEPWHYRYVGKEVAEYIYNNNITFDEYYAYYIEK